MSEHTSATWLMPPSSNSELRLCGLIIPGLPSVGVAIRWFRGGDPNLNLTSDSGQFQRIAVPGIDGIPVRTKEARRCPPCPTARHRRAPLPTHRGRRTQAAIDTAARTVIARKGILAATIADIATEAGRSTASFYNYYDSKEAMVREWALRFRDEVGERAKPVTRHGLSTRERAHQAAAAHWHTYKSAGGDDQRVAAGDGQRRLRPVLG